MRTETKMWKSEKLVSSYIAGPRKYIIATLYLDRASNPTSPWMFPLIRALLGCLRWNLSHTNHGKTGSPTCPPSGRTRLKFESPSCVLSVINSKVRVHDARLLRYSHRLRLLKNYHHLRLQTHPLYLHAHKPFYSWFLHVREGPPLVNSCRTVCAKVQLKTRATLSALFCAKQASRVNESWHDLQANESENTSRF